MAVFVCKIAPLYKGWILPNVSGVGREQPTVLDELQGTGMMRPSQTARHFSNFQLVAPWCISARSSIPSPVFCHTLILESETCDFMWFHLVFLRATCDFILWNHTLVALWHTLRHGVAHGRTTWTETSHCGEPPDSSVDVRRAGSGCGRGTGGNQRDDEFHVGERGWIMTK